MRKEKALIGLLRGLVDVVAAESARNPEFAATLENLLADIPEAKKPAARRSAARSTMQLPDLHQELNSRGEADFRLWLREQPIPTLRALISKHDLDATRRTNKWREPEKLAEFIAEHMRSRLTRGAAFLGARGTR